MTLKIGMKQKSFSVPANLLRQWCYCPRVVYYIELTDIVANYPLWVKQGENFHQLEEKLWQRRNLSRFKLKDGKKFYNLAIRDSLYGFHGVVDMAIETHEFVYPIEFKLSASNKKRGDIMQLTAYAMLLENYFSKPSQYGFLVGAGKLLHTIEISTDRRQKVLQIVDAIRRMLTRGVKPDSNASIFQCCACEYINFCNDRL